MTLGIYLFYSPDPYNQSPLHYPTHRIVSIRRSSHFTKANHAQLITWPRHDVIQSKVVVE